VYSLNNKLAPITKNLSYLPTCLFTTAEILKDNSGDARGCHPIRREVRRWDSKWLEENSLHVIFGGHRRDRLFCTDS